jgi:hypothetical protein
MIGNGRGIDAVGICGTVTLYVQVGMGFFLIFSCGCS